MKDTGPIEKRRYILAAVGGVVLAAVFIICFPSPIRLIMGEDKFSFSFLNIAGIVLTVITPYVFFYRPGKKRK